MRTTFIKSLSEIAKKNKKIVLVVGDLGFNVVEEFANQFPDRFFNAGIAEQNMATLSAGLASEGFIVFIYSIANFPTFRCAEQIRNDIDYHNFAVTTVSVGGGFAYGNLGYSHHAIQDYGLMRLFPNMSILSPGDPYEVDALIKYAINKKGPCYLRLNKNGEPNIHNKKINITHAKFLKVKKNLNSKKLILTTGSTLETGLSFLRKKKYLNYNLYSCPLWGQKYKKKIASEISKWDCIISIEDHLIDGGFYSFLNEIKSSYKLKVDLKSVALDSRIIGKVGSQKFLNNLAGLK